MSRGTFRSRPSRARAHRAGTGVPRRCVDGWWREVRCAAEARPARDRGARGRARCRVPRRVRGAPAGRRREPRPDGRCGASPVMSSHQSRSRNGSSARAASSSGTATRSAPMANCASNRSSSVALRSSRRRTRSAWANSAAATSASASPRHSPSASSALLTAVSRSPSASSERADVGQHGEPVDVHLVGCDVQLVAVAGSANDVGAEQLAQLRDVVLQNADRGPRRALAPQVVDEPIGAARLAPMDQEVDEQGTHLGRLRFDPAAVPGNLQRAEDGEGQACARRAHHTSVGAITSSCSATLKRFSSGPEDRRRTVAPEIRRPRYDRDPEEWRLQT